MNKESNTTDGTFEQLTTNGVNLAGATVYYGPELANCIECHGCSGKGWIENSKGDLKICPVCEGEGKLNKERDNLPWYPWYPRYPWYPWPSRTDDPYWPTYPIVTYYNVKTDDCTNCNNQK